MVAHRPFGIHMKCLQLWRIPPVRLVAIPAIPIVVNFLPVIDISTGSADRRADRRAFAATEQRATQGSDTRADRRALDRFTGRVLAIVVVVIIIPVTTATITLIIILPIRIVVVTVVVSDIATTSTASVLRHRI